MFLYECAHKIIYSWIGINSKRRRSRLIVSGGDAAMPPELRIPKRFSCSEMHPGLCFTRDKDVYQSVRTCAATLERLLDTPGVCFFVRAEDEDRV